MTTMQRGALERYAARGRGIELAADGLFYVDAAAGSDLALGQVTYAPLATISQAILRAPAQDVVVKVRAPQATPLREVVIWNDATHTLTLEPWDADTPWYLYGSEKFTTGWTSAGGGVYSRAVTGYTTGCQQVRIVDILDGDGLWTLLTANTGTPTTPAAGQFGIVHTAGTGTLYVHLTGGADPNTHTLEAAKRDFGLWTRKAGLLTTTWARLYVPNVAGHRTGGTAVGDDGNSLTEDCESWYGGVHGGFATATGTWTLAEYWRSLAFGALNDGYNIHGASGAQHAIIHDGEGAYNLDEGVSAHEGTVCDTYGGRYHHNGSGGITHVGTSTGLIDGAEIDHNQRTNVSTDSGGITLLETAAYTIRNTDVHDNPHEGIKAFAGTTVTDGGGNLSGTANGNGLADNLSA